MLRIAICDDSKEMLSFVSERIRQEMKSNRVECQIFSFEAGEALLKEHQAKPFDVAFLDICMPEMDGFSLSKKMTDLNREVFVIFITSREELVYDCFDYRPFNFIRKGTPETIARGISDVVTKLLKHISQNEILFLDIGYGEICKISVGDIVYLRSNGHYLEYVPCNGKCIRVRENISDKAEWMEKYNFLQGHRRYLINMKYIRNIDARNEEIILTNGEILDLGRSYREQAIEKFTKYMRTIV